MKRSGIWMRLLMLATISVVAFCGLGVYGILNTRATFESVDQVRATTLEFRQAALLITDPLNHVRQLSLVVVMAPDQGRRQKSNQQQQELSRQIDRTLADWNILTMNDAEKSAFDDVRKSWQDYKAIKDITVSKALADYREEAFINAIQAEEQQFTLLKEKVATWTKTKMDDADAIYANSKDRYKAAFRAYLIAIVVLTLLVGFAGFLVAKSIIDPIKTIRDVASRIASGASSATTMDGVLNERIVIRSNDELGELADAFNKMVENLRSTMEKLTVEERRIQAILNSTADGILTVDEKGIIKSVNAAAERLLECNAQRVIGTNVSKLVPALYHNSDSTYVDRELKPGEAVEIGGESEVDAFTLSGRQLPIALRVSEMNYLTEKLFIATLQDITSRKRSESERESLFGAIREAVQRLAAASCQILATTSQQSTGAQEQASTVSELVATADEIAQSAKQSVQRSNEVAEAARHTDMIGVSGRQAIDESITAMQHVKEQVESLAENILSLAERAQAIGEITATVNDIAEQTNVLALNAAVEASRAGEHGKGFAVVAAEVKSLAGQSKKATSQVRQILGEIQQATNAAVLSTENGTRSVSSGSAVIAKAGETIKSLAQTLAQSAQKAAQISASANQQAVGVGQLNDGVRNIDKVAQTNLQAIQQIEQAARNLNALSNELAGLVAT